MIGKLAAAWIGNRIDRSDGRGGMKGALLGAAAAGAVRRMGPWGLALAGGAYLAKKAYDRRRVR
jgi:hypothetical protein